MMITAKAFCAPSRCLIESVAGSRNQSAESAAGLEAFIADEGSSISTAKTRIFRQPTKEKRGRSFRKSSRSVRSALRENGPASIVCQRLRLKISRSDLRADAADLRPFVHQSPPAFFIGFGVHLSIDPRWTAEPNREHGSLHRYRGGRLAFARPPAA